MWSEAGEEEKEKEKVSGVDFRKSRELKREELPGQTDQTGVIKQWSDQGVIKVELIWWLKMLNVSES